MSQKPGLLSRLRARLGRSSATLGPTFRPDHVEPWKELEEQVDAELKKVGSSVVGAWEVGAAELGRVVVGRPDDKALLERYSDSLVPALQPFQDLHKGCAAAMSEGRRAGESQGTFAAATAPVLGLVEGLGPRAVDGWRKTTAHLSPVFAAAKDPAAARARFEAGGAALAEGCARAERVLRDRLMALPDAPDLWTGLTGAVEAWQLALTRELEIALDRSTKGLVADLRP